jgi:hypothetical protein
MDVNARRGARTQYLLMVIATSVPNGTSTTAGAHPASSESGSPACDSVVVEDSAAGAGVRDRYNAVENGATLLLERLIADVDKFLLPSCGVCECG